MLQHLGLDRILIYVEDIFSRVLLKLRIKKVNLLRSLISLVVKFVSC